ncbi:hypothetical protein QJS04_geneDACA022448 [Acorus gramineus]|uniref:Uncharacterized protein n=1 Tax=Acorus gramineus TaxID=55184 RepID=A0AAV9AJ58_ACOGR|nr:hypothetical protein QJS04_geneDACA022448 [Acorus gramineus]
MNHDPTPRSHFPTAAANYPLPAMADPHTRSSTSPETKLVQRLVVVVRAGAAVLDGGDINGASASVVSLEAVLKT